MAKENNGRPGAWTGSALLFAMALLGPGSSNTAAISGDSTFGIAACLDDPAPADCVVAAATCLVNSGEFSECVTRTNCSGVHLVEVGHVVSTIPQPPPGFDRLRTGLSQDSAQGDEGVFVFLGSRTDAGVTWNDYFMVGSTDGNCLTAAVCDWPSAANDVVSTVLASTSEALASDGTVRELRALADGLMPSSDGSDPDPCADVGLWQDQESP